MTIKKNDWIAANLNNPTYDNGDFKMLGLTSENTQLLDYDFYKKQDVIQNSDLFKDPNGNFSEQKFKDFYNKAASEFQYLDASEQGLQYDPFDFRYLKEKNASIRNPEFKISRVSNPTQMMIGVEGNNKITSSGLSTREIAQKSKVYDSATGKELDYSPNDRALTSNPISWIADLFKDPLVEAVYEEDGTHLDPITQTEVKHSKGEHKLNADGLPYYETLNGRSLIGKRVLSSLDTLTIDGEGLNKYDFIDSDGLDKSVTGTISKVALGVLPMLTPYGEYYSGALVVREMLKTLPMLEGIVGAITGNNTPTKFTEISNRLAGTAEHLSSSQSDWAQQNLVTIEGLSNLLEDVALQWGQQKQVAKLISELRGQKRLLNNAKNKAFNLYKKQVSLAEEMLKAEKASADDIAAYIGKEAEWEKSILGQQLLSKANADVFRQLESINKLGQDASLLYMALVSNTDVYNTMLEHGATKREAFLVSLGSTSGMFAVDKYLNLGKAFFDAEDAMTKISMRQAFRNSADVWKKSFKTITENQNLTKAQKMQQLFTKGLQFGKSTVSDYIDNLEKGTLGAIDKAFTEGLEEVSEELASDMSKQIYELLHDFGFDTTTDNVDAFNNIFDPNDDNKKRNLQNLASRYLMNFTGGFLGGGLFYGVETYQSLRKNPEQKQLQTDLIYLMRNNKTQDLLNSLDEMHKKGKLGSRELSAVPLMENGKPRIDSDGHILYGSVKNGEQSQNDFIYNRLREELIHLDAIIKESGLNQSEEDLYKSMVLNNERLMALQDYLQDSSYTTQYQETYQKLVNDYVNARSEIDKLNSQTDPTKRTESWQAELDAAKQRAQDIYDSIQDFKSGKSSIQYLEKFLFYLDNRLHSVFMTTTFPQWLHDVKGVDDVNNLSSETYAEYKEEYLKESRNLQKSQLTERFKEYKRIMRVVSPELAGIQERVATFRQWYNKIESILDPEKGPFSKDRKYYTYKDQLPDESQEEFEIKDKAIEGESEIEFALRRKERKLKIKALNDQENAKLLGEVKELIEQGGGFLDSGTKRRLSLLVAKRRSDVLEEVKEALGIQYSDQEISNLVESIDENFSNFDEIIEKIKSKVYNSVATQQIDAFQTKLDILEKLDNGLSGEGIDVYDKIIAYLNNKGIDLNNVKDVMNEVYNLVYDITNNGNYAELIANDFVNPDNAQIALHSVKVGNKFVKIEDAYDPFEQELLDNEDVEQEQEDAVNGVIEGLNQLKQNTQQDPYYQFFEYLDSRPMKVNPITDIVKKLALTLNIDHSNVEKVLEHLYSRLSSGRHDDFVLTGDEKSALDEADYLLQMTGALIYATYNSEDFHNPIGHHNILNKVARDTKVEDWEDLPVISDDVASLYQSELGAFLNEIGQPFGDSWTPASWRYWDAIHSGNKIQKFLNSDASYAKAKLELFKNERESFKAIDGSFDLLQGIDAIDKSRDPKAVLHDIENLYYANLQKVLETKTFKEVLESSKIGDMLKGKDGNTDQLKFQETGTLDENISYARLTKMDIGMYLLGISTISSSTWYKFLQDNLEQFNFAPVITQMAAARIACGAVDNLDMYKQGITFMHKTSGTKALLIDNYVTVFGNGGAGKTSVVAAYVRRYGGGEQDNVWLTGPTDRQKENLTKSLSGIGFNKTELFEKILGRDIYRQLLQEGENINSTSQHVSFFTQANKFKAPIISSDIPFLKQTSVPKIIIIDEITHFNSVELQILQKFADKNNILILGLGDNFQNGYDKIIRNDNQANNINNSNIGNEESFFSGRCARLGITLRESNIQKYTNISNIGAYLQQLDLPINHPKRKEIIDAITESLLDRELTLNYYLGDELNGDYITKTIDSELMNKLVLEDEDTIAYIGSKDSDNFSKLKTKFGDKIIALTADEVQGSEFTYVVVDQKWNLDDTQNSELNFIEDTDFLRQLYTMSTRGKKGVVFIDNGLSQIISNKLERHKVNTTTFSEETIGKFKKDLQDFIGTLNLSDVAPRITTHKVEKKEVKEDDSKKEIIKPQFINSIQKDPDNPLDTIEKDVIIVKPEYLDRDILVYGNVSLGGVKRYKNDDNIYVWEIVENDGVLRDIAAVADDEDFGETDDPKLKNKLTSRLMYFKSALLYGHPFEGDTANLLKDFINKDEFDSIKYKIVVSKPNKEVDYHIGYSNLNNENTEKNKLELDINSGYMFRIVASFEHNGKHREITLGTLSNPQTTKDNKQLIINNANDIINKSSSETLKQKMQIKIDNFNKDLEQYEAYLNGLVKEANKNGETFSFEISPENINFVGTTDIKNRRKVNGSYVNVPFKRLRDFKKSNPHLVISDAMFFRSTDSDDPLSKSLSQHAVIFVSGDTLLKAEDLPGIWKEERERADGKHSVRMIKLKNAGVSLSDLHSAEWKDIISTPTKGGTTNRFPFELEPMAFRMLTSLWNGRANLGQFLNKVEDSVQKDYGTLHKAGIQSLEDLDTVLSIIGNIYDPEKLKTMSYDDLAKSTLSDENYQKYLAIEQFNKEIQDTRTYRLGKAQKSNHLIRQIQGLNENDSPYSKKQIDGKVYGIFTTYSQADKMYKTLDGLLNLITANYKIIYSETLEEVKPEIALGTNTGNKPLSWQIKKENIKDQTPLIIDGIQFPNAGSLHFLPLLLCKLHSKSFAYAEDPDNFDFSYNGSNSRFFSYTDENGEDAALDVEDIIRGGYDTVSTLELILHGTTEDIHDNPQRATDAWFKNGFYVDPMSSVDTTAVIELEKGSFVRVGNSDLMFLVDVEITKPTFGVGIHAFEDKKNPVKTQSIVEPNKQVKTKLKTTNKVNENDLYNYKGKDGLVITKTLGDILSELSKKFSKDLPGHFVLTPTAVDNCFNVYKGKSRNDKKFIGVLSMNNEILSIALDMEYHDPNTEFNEFKQQLRDALVLDGNDKISDFDNNVKNLESASQWIEDNADNGYSETLLSTLYKC